MTLAINPAALAEAAAGPTRYRMLIDGAFVDGAEGREGSRVSPGHGVEVSRYAFGTRVDVDRAVAAARRAFDTGPWPRLKAAERSAVLLRAADIIDRRREEIARLDVIESGKPISQALGEIAGAADIWRYAAALCRTLHGESYANLGDDMLGVVLREPIGVVALITPWNFPFLIIAQKLPFALAAGCTAVVKPSEMTSASTVVLGEILMEAGLPNGAVNILLGTGPDVGAHMTAHPGVDMVSFTGSTRVGQATMQAAAPTLKKVAIELGGKNAQVVFRDADLEAAVDAAVFGAFFNAGECCNAGSRVILQEGLEAEFLAAFEVRARNVVVGDPLDPRTKVGAIITPDHLRQIHAAVASAEAAGARLFADGRGIGASAGQYMGPTVIAGVKPEMPVARDEIFGPVLSVLSFRTAEEAAQLLNGTDYGLSAGVWSRDIDTCMNLARAARTGTVWVNTFMDGYPELPFGGAKQSGLGRELGKAAVEDYTETKTIQFHAGPRTGWWATPATVD
ncbi:aldehyde dehydrogenase family protein [Chthonobacter albigriseus]|uniref:aldehyde dehydrogenase family protein n=1 Tax=Chthonobacter albigriseus TaxID=1683161 RepID=UPI0015EF0F1E|nr:aldehyde dehydrogenase family protein [Chthonobacter albigriseus]